MAKVRRPRTLCSISFLLQAHQSCGQSHLLSSVIVFAILPAAIINHLHILWGSIILISTLKSLLNPAYGATRKRDAMQQLCGRLTLTSSFLLLLATVWRNRDIREIALEQLCRDLPLELHVSVFSRCSVLATS